MGYNILLTPVIIIFILNGFGQLFYAIKLKKQYPEAHNIKNSYLTFVLWIIAGLLYPLYFSSENVQIHLFQIISVIFICIFTPLLIFLILSYQFFFIIKKNPNIIEKRNLVFFLKKFEESNNTDKNMKSYSLKTDVHRKVLHLFPAIIIIILWIFAVNIWEGIWNANIFWGISGEQFGTFLIITTGYSGILMFTALDYVRLSYIFTKRKFFHLLPNNVSNLLIKSLKRNEIFEFTKPVVLILAFTPIFFLPFGIFASASLIGTIGDGAASIIGIKYGKYNYPKNSNKTVIGYFAGFIASFIISLLCLLIFSSDLEVTKQILIAISGAFTFLIIDLVSINIDDNILNPLLCGGIMGILYFFI